MIRWDVVGFAPQYLLNILLNFQKTTVMAVVVPLNLMIPSPSTGEG
jgi:hypothetical protein